LTGIETTAADLVFTLGIAIDPRGAHGLLGATPTGYYEPNILVAASLWLLRRQLIEEVGPWRFYRECYNVPSQDWLYRAWRMKKKMVLIPRVTAIAIPSGGRTNVYANREFKENQYYYERLVNEGDFLEKELAKIASASVARTIDLHIWPHFRRVCRNVIYRASLKCGIPPTVLRNFVWFRRRGGFIDSLRANRGLSNLR
jgi:hypothetical protein